MTRHPVGFIRRKPHFLIIGAMKSATSTLHDQLAMQPGLFMSTPKEPNFFSNDEIYVNGMAWYTGLFDGAPDGAICGESSTHYTKLPTYPHTLSRMQAHLPDARLIYVMRHPVDRLISHYIHEWTQGVISTDINSAIHRHTELIDYSRYSFQIDPFLKAYGPDRVLPVFFDRLTARAQAELERVAQFIGYGQKPLWQETLQAANVSRDRLRVSPLRDAIVDHPLATVIRRKLVPKTVREWVKQFWQMKKRPQIREDRLQGLKAVFDADLHILGEKMGLRLTCDTFRQMTVHCQNPRFR
ncbi:MAG: sulfotransferase [Desulfatirhabdiaceae bacterium]